MTRMDATRIEHIEPEHAADAWPLGRARLGLILLSVDRASESELRRMLPADLVEMHVNRVTMGTHTSLATLRALEADLSRSARDLLPETRLDAIAFACTSGAVAIGRERVRACIGESHPGVPVTAPLEAAGCALRALEAERVAVVTPYVDEVNELIAGALEDDGRTISRFGSFHLAADPEMTAVAPASLHAAALALDCADAEAVFICCTALRPAGILADLEQRLGKPVISSHQAMLWHALALAGVDEPIHGYGSLLERPQRSRHRPA